MLPRICQCTSCKIELFLPATRNRRLRFDGLTRCPLLCNSIEVYARKFTSCPTCDSTSPASVDSAMSPRLSVDETVLCHPTISYDFVR